jgi:hypothetical protein
MRSGATYFRDIASITTDSGDWIQVFSAALDQPLTYQRVNLLRLL